MSDVFISYARSTESQARAVAEALRELGFSIWRDDELPAHRAYTEVIEERLSSAKAVIVLWSADAAKSEWVQSEADHARNDRKLVQLTLDGTPLPMPFDRIQCADMRAWNGAPTAPGWLKVVASVRALVSGEARGQPLAMALPKTSKHRPTLAVLPLANRTGDAADEMFADALVEDIIDAVSVGRGLRAIARGTTAHYRDKVIDERTIGSELGADYVMQGNVRRVGATLRTTVHLVEGESGAILWTQKFDRALAELGLSEDQLAAEIASHLVVEIQRTKMDRAIKKPDDVTAFEAVQRSWASIPRFTSEGLKQGIEAARKALALAPDYALAESSLGVALGVLYQRNGSREPDLLTEAMHHVDRALELGEKHATVLFQAALVRSYALQWQESLQLAERSVELNPNLPEARHTLGGAYTRFERYDEALAQLDEADRLAPRGFFMAISLMNRCWALFGAGRLSEALDVTNRLLVISPSDRTGLMMRLVIQAALDAPEAARADMRELRKVSPGVSFDVFMGTILASRQADAPRARNAALFQQIWDATPFDAAPAALSGEVTATT